MQHRSVCLFTNLCNGEEAEDLFLARALNEHFHVHLCHSADVRHTATGESLALIRNVWPLSNQTRFIDDFLRLSKNPTVTYNPLNGNGDQRGKRYLAALYQQKYPVIPTIATTRQLRALPTSHLYLIKPEYGCDGRGHHVLPRNGLTPFTTHNCVIQPLLPFVCELSFYFIDNHFEYAITTRNRLDPTAAVDLYSPTEDDIRFATRFIHWNRLPFGLQRIDALQTHDGRLLLLEIEDFCPYLYLLHLDKALRSRVVARLASSVQTRLVA